VKILDTVADFRVDTRAVVWLFGHARGEKTEDENHRRNDE
jgi:hypothetical protein